MRPSESTGLTWRSLSHMRIILTGLCGLVSRNSFRLLWLLCVLYFLCSIVQASRATLDFDEVVTLRVSQMGSVRGIWDSLLAGCDTQPPLQYVLTRVSLGLFGEGLVPLRLPTILGFWCMALCLYAWLAKRFSAVLALAGALFPLLTAAYPQALIARPYGLMLGFCALTLLSWQRAAQVGHRTLALTGLALSLAAGVYSHFYAILVFVPIVIGELVRALNRKSLDYPVCAAIIAGSLPVFLLIPLMKAGHQYSEHFWAQPGLASVPSAYANLLGGRAPLFLILIAGLASVSVRWASNSASASQSRVNFPPHELAAVLSLAGMPFLVWIVACLYTKAFTPSYPIVAVIGLAILLVVLVDTNQEHRILFGGAMALCFLGFAAVQLRHSVNELFSGAPADKASSLHPSGWQGHFELPASLDIGELPVVISDPHTFGYLTHYAEARFKRRLYYLTHHTAAVRYSGYDTDDRLLGALKHWTDWNVEDYSAFVEKNGKFLVYSTEGWLVPKLLADHAHIELLGQYEDEYLYRVIFTPAVN